MARRGQSAAKLKELRRKYGLGEFASRRKRAKKTTRKRARSMPSSITSNDNMWGLQ